MTSILIRKYCQPVLDEAGYPMFFATVTDDYHQPSLAIYTTCGKPFVNIHGVKFSRRKPSVTESEYSAVLLKQWMERHKEDFDAYVEAYTDFYSMPKLEKSVEVGDLEVSVSEDDRDVIRVNRPFKYVNTDGKEYTVTFRMAFTDEGRKVLDVRWGDFPVSQAQLAKLLSIPAKVMTAAKKLRAKHQVQWDITARYNEAKLKLNTCTI